MPPQLPKLVLPKFEVMTKSPTDALAEIRNSLSATAASIEAALPKIGGQGPGGLKLPRIEQIFKGPAAAIEEIKSSIEATVSGLAPGQGTGLAPGQGGQRGTITEEKPPAPGVGGRGQL